MQLHHSYRKQLRPILWTILCLAAIQLVLWLSPALQAARGIAGYPPIHTLLETVAIIISMLVFAVGWGIYDKERPSNLILLACVFLGVAMLDLLHALSYPGMPDFITHSDTEKAINFWLMARVLAAFGLLAVSWLPWRKMRSTASRWLMLCGVLFLVCGAGWIGLLHQPWLPSTFIPGQGLTEFKVGAEYFIVALYLVTASRLFMQMRSQQPYDVVGLFGAVSVMAMSEIFFTLYSDVTDVFNLLGHVYKAIAYGFIYNSIFISNIRMPYQKLYESRNLLQSVIDTIPMRVFWKDRESRYLGCNIAFAHDVGETSPADVFGKADSELAWRDLAALYHADDQQVMNSNIPKLAFEESQTTPDKKHVLLRTSKIPLRNAGDDIVGVLGVYEDITEQKRMERDLHMAHSAIKKSRNAFFWVNAQGQVSYANDYACQSLGYSREELIGLHVWDFDPDFPPDAQDRFWENIKQNGMHILESRHRRKDGTIFPIEVTANYIASDGEELVFCSVQNITERKQAEARVQRLTQLYLALSEINQAIVRMQQQADLFPLVCRCAVEFGGMNKAWVGQLDKASGLIIPVASYGEWQSYLDDIVVSSHADVPEGRGPTGTALRENRHMIINDYFASPSTAPWQAQAARFGWKSAAAFPIQRGGQPFAVLTVYHAQTDAFDGEVTALLEELSKDVSFALDNFDRETQRKAGEESLRLAASVYEASSEAMMITDADNRIIAINPAFTTITGYVLEEVAGKDPRLLSSGRHDQAFFRDMWNAINTTGKWEGEIWDRRKSGEVYPKWATINAITSQDDSVRRYVALFSDLTQKKESDELIWHQANFDSLTGLPNRRMFHDRLDQEIKKSHRAGLPLALLFLDLDNFKEVNDTLGHAKGDMLLNEAAYRLLSCVRESDTVARFGGDEFTLILSELDDPDSIDRVAQCILQKLSEPFQLADEIAYVSASIGITLYPSDATDIEALLKNADQAMYAAKGAGRNCCHYFTPAMQVAAQTKMRLANDLRGALSDNQFWVAYQPIVDLQTGAIRKAEALLRWQHPKLGLVSPAEFIPIAEHTGLITDIGDWVFRQAAQQAKHWQAIYHHEFQISVNKSPMQINDKSDRYDPWPLQLLNLGLSGASIVVEITEGLLLDAGALIKEKLLEYRNAQMQVSLDDFGTGYSSLSYLKKFDIDYLKIDQSFVRNMTRESEEMALCEAIIVMAHKLRIEVIAEGIETAEQRDLLAAAGCDFGQGYLFSKPLPANELEKLLLEK